MNRKTIMVGMILILIGITFAYTVGTTISQQNFDNQDFSQANLNLQKTNVFKANDRIFVEFSYDTLRMDINGDWEVVQLTDRIPYYLGNYRNCRDTNTIQECKVVAKDFIKDQAKAFKGKERAWLEEQKTKSLNDEIGVNDFDDLNLN